MQQETIELVKAEREGLKRELAERNRWSQRPVSLWICAIGLALLAFWYLTNDGSSVSTLILLAGLTMLGASVLLYFMTPAIYLRSEVADGEVLGNAVNLHRILSGMLLDAKGLYLPVTPAGELKVFIPATGCAQAPLEAMKASGNIFVLPKDGPRGLLLEPPGYGLIRQARQIGFRFRGDRLEADIREALEKGMELASAVGVKWVGDEVEVSLTKISNKGLCNSIRKEHPGICTQIGCPICSFVACAIAEGSGRCVRIKHVAARGGSVSATFELLPEG